MGDLLKLLRAFRTITDPPPCPRDQIVDLAREFHEWITQAEEWLQTRPVKADVLEALTLLQQAREFVTSRTPAPLTFSLN